MQTFSARKEGRAKVIYPYELALYAVQGHEVWQDTPEEKVVARAGHPEDLVGIAFEDNSCTLKIGG
ncbi:hypothetical protein [Hespellia stercorisuis]|uniref:Uncharacterized protein n=1 Tax=Hespellia stercorisuis DSM 15480 TaxID=1121950 RepID=A0A1M6MWP8_9FIRM|nr:hypothetical protein [Hespellia stercorisuis]SHJ87839.1 hypothetical protein SAMN02745243_01630 [Hespellia stercorisuis DSM 15480]